MNAASKKDELEQLGFSIIESCYSIQEVQSIIDCIENTPLENKSFLRNKELYAIRQLLKNIPTLAPLLLNKKLKTLISQLGSENFFLSKALYFDKARLSNWFVPFHQDLSITVNQRQETPGYSNWTFKKGQYGVQPPLSVLENTITARIHLDDTDEHNGALKVIPSSHLDGVIMFDKIPLYNKTPQSCRVSSGGIMFMKPLILHASNRSTTTKKRRVIHLEFCDKELKSPLQWQEKFVF